MKALIVYDSIYGNTEEIAMSIGEVIGSDTRILKASEANPSDLEYIELLITGSPTYGGRPTPAMLEFLGKLKDTSLREARIATFDTRVPAKWVKIFGFAARRIQKSLKSRGGTPAVKPEGFYVKGTKGPLVEGELERAAGWARKIIGGIEG